jgi:two-component sensor histidine kinase/integral membrane sensor domain MASE1
MRYLEIVIVAVIYCCAAKLGQTFAIPPGNITPVWIPSGIMLAAILIRGYYIWPGIFLGAFIGNVWAYIDPGSVLNVLKCLFTGAANGIGDVLSAAGAAYLIVRTTGTKNPFARSADFVKFIAFGAMAGPAVSAIFGVTALCVAGFVPWDVYGYTLLTWWTGDGVGALVIAPAIIVWLAERKKTIPRNRIIELAAFSVILTGTAIFCLGLLPLKGLIHIPLFSLATILIWSAFRFGQGVTFSAVLLISVMAIAATATGHGPFSGKELTISLIELQWFLAVMSITIFVLTGVIAERIRTGDELEQRVVERTAELTEANEQRNLEIEERKRAEEQLKDSLIEKEMLLSEVHHRVKNNMQVIISLLRLQAKEIKDKKYAAMLEESRNRIESMALIHEKLYESKDFSNIDFSDYVNSLAGNLFRSYGMKVDRLKLNIEIKDVRLGLDNAVPCGLIINELVSNSIKHAFPEGSDGRIIVSLGLINENEIELIVSDDGIGLPQDVDIRASRTMGLQLVMILAEHQLKGKVEVQRANGTAYNIQFNRKNK